MKTLKIGSWLGIDIGSSREKICSFCLIESGKNGIKVRFEKGSADAAYPSQNSLEALIEPMRAPTYLKPEVETGHKSVNESGSCRPLARKRKEFSPLLCRYRCAGDPCDRKSWPAADRKRLH